MLNQLLHWVNQVTFLGIKDGESYLVRFRKRVLNRTYFLIAFFCLVLILEGFWNQQNKVTLVPVILMAISVGLLLLNHRGYFKISFLVLSFFFPTLFLGIIYLYGPTLKLDYTISFFIVLVLTLYDNSRIRIINILYLIVLQFFSFYFISNFTSPYAAYVDYFDSIIVLTGTTFGLFILTYQFIRISKAFQDHQQTYAENLDLKNRELKRNITEKEMLNRQLQERTEELQRANDFLESYTYITSHDLKTPIRNINSFSELLQKKLGEVDNEDIKDYLAFIRSGALQINSIVNGIIENAQSNRSSLEVEQVDCREMISDIERKLEIRLSEINGRIIYEGLPGICADKMMLQKVFFNLIDNGLKYNDSPAPSVSISYTEREQEHEFAVSDNGIGIQSRYSQDIFKMFKKLHGVQEFSGSGVGLALCKKIIELHGGKIWLEDPAPGGSTFRFIIPKES
ncbi:sensor histidine kinase [Flavilitoribacter nigricans]|uniref:histidine kinase n=1 Tax=Flavilitoribacter nigricans (strain ATCC 23147 / DSM 23189 / NBRC 102662 / NCIMB 1420 / SS-2) TaxID=1122177 RepID=A0A2D0NID6_FLAN2|nr:ATP-binding protein [Flavilitoribacter nigricans]PHN08265.1 hypothetical protein CRP01_02785 [Flavilitoribacter nigricans DSM 23189 = NBRC 102662]